MSEINEKSKPIWINPKTHRIVKVRAAIDGLQMSEKIEQLVEDEQRDYSERAAYF